MRTLLIVFLLPISVLANEVMIDRYTLVEPNVSAEQRFPLIEVKTISMPTRVVINSEAVDVVLKGTGYAQSLPSNRSDIDKALMKKPLADINRQFINMRIHEMLKAIAGVGYAPVVDPINRLVAFEKTNEYF